MLVVPVAIAGAVALRRLGRPSWPFLAQGVAVSLVSALVYGLPRFRVGWDVAACVLVAVAIVYWGQPIRPRAGGVSGADAMPEEAPSVP